MRLRVSTSIRIFPAIIAGVVLSWDRLEASELVQIRGLSTITESQAEEWIANQLTFIESSGVSMARADDVAYFLETAMRDRGFGDASVDWKIEGEGEGRIIVLNVSEGSSLLVRSFAIAGNTALEEAAIVELLTAATRKRLGLKSDAPVPFVRSDIKSGQRKVEDFYTKLGFGDASTDLEIDQGENGVTVSLTIEEGLQHIVGGIDFGAAPDSLSDRKYLDAIEEIRTDFTGRKHNAALVSNLETRLRSLAVDSGFYQASVDVRETGRRTEGETEYVDLEVVTDWGNPVTLSGVTVRGNEKVRSEFFDQHFRNLVGQPYSPKETSGTINQLLETGAFETIRSDPVEQPDGTYHLEVEVEEAYSRNLGVFVGSSNYEGPIGGFVFRHLNLFQSVRTLDSKIEFSRRGATGNVDYKDPWFLGSDIEFGAGIFGQSRSEEGYDKWETGLNYEFTKRFGRQNRNLASFFGRASYTDVTEAEIDPALLGDTQYAVHFLGISLAHDRRDDRYLPREGFIAQTSAAVSSSATGSEVEFFKATGRLGYYIPVGNHNFRMAARAGSITPIGDTREIPIDLRFYNGGPQTVRSFQERSLGPRDPTSGYHVGGEFYTIFNIEYEVPIGALDGLSFVGFTDAGNLLFDAGDAGLTDMRYAIGAGLRYRTPIGPLRMEYGYNPDRRPGEPQGTFHFGFGFSY